MSAPIPVTRVSQSRLTEALRENSEFGATFSDHGAGTAAIIAPIACIQYRDRDLQFPAVTDSSVAARLRPRLVAIQTGREPDTHNWLLPV